MQEKEMEAPKHHWHLRKEVHVSTLIFLICQTIGLVWWASKLDERVHRMQQQVTALETKSESTYQLAERIGRIEENIVHVRERVKVIDNKIDRIR